MNPRKDLCNKATFKGKVPSLILLNSASRIQRQRDGDVGLGTIITSALFLAAIIGIVACMSRTRDGGDV